MNQDNGLSLSNSKKNADELFAELFSLMQSSDNPTNKNIETESIVAKSGDTASGDEFALNLMITKALDEKGDRLFQDGDKASLRREVEANILQEIQLAMINSGQDKEVKQAKADLKS